MKNLSFLLQLITHIFENSNPDMDVILVPKLKHVVILLVAVDSHKVCGMLLLTFLPGLLPLGLIAIVVFLDRILILIKL